MEMWMTGILCVIALLYGLKRLKARWPNQQKIKEMIREALPPQLKGNIVELGAGWKSAAGVIAERFPEVQITSYSISPLPCFYAWIKQRLQPVPNLTISWQDFFIPPLDHAQAVVCYLYPGAMPRLKEKFEKELLPGTYIVSYLFAIPEWKPAQVLELEDMYRSKIYIYQKEG